MMDSSGGGGSDAAAFAITRQSERCVASAPAALLWHMRLKRPERVPLVDAWAATRHCDLAFDALRCEEHRSCAGASWRACRPILDERRNANCSSRLEVIAE